MNEFSDILDADLSATSFNLHKILKIHAIRSELIIYGDMNI